MKKIWKYTLRITDVQGVLMPQESKVLSVQFQGEDLNVWAEVDTANAFTKPQDETLFLIVGTGNPMPDVNMDDYRFVGTVQQHGGLFVWHVYVEDLTSA